MTTGSVVRPRRAITAVAAWALIQVLRISGLSVAQGVLAGDEAAAWLFPGLGDTFLAITAPFVALVVWRRSGLAIWVTAIVWFILSIVDHLDGLTATLTTPLPRSIGGSSASFATGLLVLSALDLAALALLARKAMRSHYLGSLRL